VVGMGSSPHMRVLPCSILSVSMVQSQDFEPSLPAARAGPSSFPGSGPAELSLSNRTWCAKQKEGRGVIKVDA